MANVPKLSTGGNPNGRDPGLLAFEDVFMDVDRNLFGRKVQQETGRSCGVPDNGNLAKSHHSLAKNRHKTGTSIAKLGSTSLCVIST